MALSMNSIYQVANNTALAQLSGFSNIDITGNLSQITNEVIPTMFDATSLVVSNRRMADRRWQALQMPVPQFGRLISQVGSKVVKPEDVQPTTAGTSWTDFVQTPQIIENQYSGTIIEMNYPLTLRIPQLQRIQGITDINKLASVYAEYVFALWRDITEDHDKMVPYLLGWLAEQQLTQWIEIPPVPSASATPADIQTWGIQVVSTINNAIRLYSRFHSSALNLMGVQSRFSPEDLILVAFDNPAGGMSVLDVLRGYIALSATFNTQSVEQLFGVAEILEMPYMGNLQESVDGTTAIARANGITNLPGMQTADMSTATAYINGTNTNLNNVKFGLLNRGAFNVGSKNIWASTAFSARAKSVTTHVLTEYQAWAGGPFSSLWFATSS